ncbi:hypothetical protein ACET3Z_027121 [Daucus carota]
MEMHRCSSNHHGQCTCGLFHTSNQSTNSFSMLFNNNHKPYDDYCPFAASSSYSSAVDCTLSLGTPSTRMSNESYYNNNNNNNSNAKAARSSSYMPNFCWDILQPKNNSSKPSRGSNSGSNGSPNIDPLLARRCANCDTTSTPLWRNGPRGPKSLCNACGIRFKKEERRATAAAATTSSGAGMDSNSWIHHQYSQSSNQKIPCLSPTSFGNEFRFVDHEDDRDSETGIPFLSWRLNVTDRPGLVHDFTR